MTADLRDRLEANATAICLAFAGACFAVGLLLQHGSRVVSKALTWGAIQ